VIILFYIYVLLIIAFFTLFERKLIARFHIRKGPNKVSFLGLLQPLVDAIKLLTKQTWTPYHANKTIYHIAPCLVLIQALIIWQFIPFSYHFINCRRNLLWYLIFGSISVFFGIIRGWRRNNKYSLIGTLRFAASTISYEATLIFCILTITFLYSTVNIKRFLYHKDFIILLISPIFFISILAELHRTPFDFSERERELVSGYNTEYSGKAFAFLFLGEYSILLFNRILLRTLFLGFNNIFFTIIRTLLITFLFTNIRVSLCRYRYDLLIEINWKLILPLIILILSIICVIKR